MTVSGGVKDGFCVGIGTVAVIKTTAPLLSNGETTVVAVTWVTMGRRGSVPKWLRLVSSTVAVIAVVSPVVVPIVVVVLTGFTAIVG